MRRRKITVTQPNDLAFLLIIFFLLLVGVYGISSITISTTSQKIIVTNQAHVILTLDATGSLSHKGSTLSPEALHQLLENTKTATLKIAGETQWQEIITVLAQLDERGISVAMERLL